MLKVVEDEISKIIENKQIKTVFQPIISLRDGSLLGHEALSRVTGKTFIENPDQLFYYAATCNRLWDMEQLCRTLSLESAFLSAGQPAYNKKLFINVNPNDFENICQTITTDFERDVLSYYNENDIRNGYITAANRRGKIEKFPLITLSFVYVTNEHIKYTDSHQISEQLAALKKHCKQRKKKKAN
jgi:hypothetical protein